MGTSQLYRNQNRQMPTTSSSSDFSFPCHPGGHYWDYQAHTISLNLVTTCELHSGQPNKGVCMLINFVFFCRPACTLVAPTSTHEDSQTMGDVWWWLGNIRNQGISSHGIDLRITKYSPVSSSDKVNISTRGKCFKLILIPHFSNQCPINNEHSC